MSGERIFVGLGSNLAGPVQQVLTALNAIDRIDATRLVRRSSLYSNPPLAGMKQPDYVNAVAEIASELEPHDLLSALQRIERQQGRRRDGGLWQARTIDLDLLLYGERTMRTPRLILPHPQMHLRAFVLHPLSEIAPEVMVPARATAAALASTVSASALERIDETVSA